jgi:hypothetical protein
MVLPATPPKPRRAEADAEPASPQDARARAAAGLEPASERRAPPSPADANAQRALRREPVAPPSDGTGPVARELGSGSSVGRTSETTGTLRDGGKSFDSIFDELQGLVLETLQSSVEESLASASTSEKELSETTGRALVPSEPVGSRDSDTTGGADAKSAPAGAKFAKPDDDDDEAGEAAAEASATPAAPYDWGVKKAARPPGAWLVENEEKPEEPAAKQTVSETAPAPKPVPALTEGAPAAAGGRSYLVKKLGDEVRKIQPAVEALQAKGIVSAKDLGAAADAGKPAPEKTDDMVSVDDVADRAPVDLEKELSPARLVDELRRLRRLTDALMAKGVLSESDLQKRSEDA